MFLGTRTNLDLLSRFSWAGLGGVLILGGLVALFAWIVTLGPLYGYEKVEDEARAYTIVQVYPPKHFGLAFRDDETGETTGRIGISKHCNRWREVQVGAPVTLVRERWLNKWGTDFQYRTRAWSSLCPGH